MLCAKGTRLVVPTPAEITRAFREDSPRRSNATHWNLCHKNLPRWFWWSAKFGNYRPIQILTWIFPTMPQTPVLGTEQTTLTEQKQKNEKWKVAAEGLSCFKTINSTYLFQGFMKFIQDINQEFLSILLCLFHKCWVELAKSWPKYFWWDTVRVPKPHVCHHIGKSSGDLTGIPWRKKGKNVSGWFNEKKAPKNSSRRPWDPKGSFINFLADLPALLTLEMVSGVLQPLLTCLAL